VSAGARGAGGEPPRVSGKEPKPFLKWAGGKGQLLEQFAPHIPDFRVYHEPFVGGGALFFRLRPKRASLTDINEELINCYRAVCDDCESVIRLLRRHAREHCKDYYYHVRALPQERDLSPTERAARLIYLNRTCYNGLYRVNSKGEFNVPFGRYKNPTICDEDLLRAASAALASARIEVAPFDSVLKRAKRGHFVYFDPPYHPLSRTSYFTSYSADGFGEEDQIRLRDVFAELARRGVAAMLSNSYSPLVLDLYRGFRIEKVFASRSINSNSGRRGRIPEALVLNYGMSAVEG
jgi:DNA adenine methylase